MFITKFLSIQNQARIYHWQTKSYSEHKSFGKLYEELDGLIDSFVEVYFGKNGVRKAGNTFDLSLANYDESNPIEFLNDSIAFLTTELTPLLKPEDTDLLNIRDEMLAVLNTTKYLLTLK